MAKGFKQASNSLDERVSKSSEHIAEKTDKPEMAELPRVTEPTGSSGGVKFGKGFSPAAADVHKKDKADYDTKADYINPIETTEKVNDESVKNPSTYYDEPLPKLKKKSHKGLIIGIAAVIVVCAVAGAGHLIVNVNNNGKDTSTANTSYSTSGSSSASNTTNNSYTGTTKAETSSSNTNTNTSSVTSMMLDGEIPCATTSYVSNNFGFAYKIPADFEYDDTINENGAELSHYVGEDAEGNDLEIMVGAVTKEIGMKNIAEMLSAIRNEGVNINVADTDNLPTIEKKCREVYIDWLKSEHEKLGFITKTDIKSNGYVFTASLPSEGNNNMYEEQYIIKREFYDDGKAVVLDATDQIHMDSDNDIQDHKWIGGKEIDCGNYIKIINVSAEAYYDEDITPSVSKLKYIINQFN